MNIDFLLLVEAEFFLRLLLEQENVLGWPYSSRLGQQAQHSIWKKSQLGPAMRVQLTILAMQIKTHFIYYKREATFGESNEYKYI